MPHPLDAFNKDFIHLYYMQKLLHMNHPAHGESHNQTISAQFLFKQDTLQESLTSKSVLPVTWYLLTLSCLICSNLRFSSLWRSILF